VRILKQKRKKTKNIELYFNGYFTNDFEIATSTADYLINTFINTENQGEATYFTIRIDVYRTCRNVALFINVFIEIRKINMYIIFQVTVQTVTLSTQDICTTLKITTCTYNVTLLRFRLSIWQRKHKNVFCACCW